MQRANRHRTSQDGLAAWATVTAAAAAVLVVAGGAWAVTRGGNSSGDAGTGPTTTPTVTVSSPSKSHSGGSETPPPWSKACTKAATQATKAGLTVLAPSPLPSGWSLSGCRFQGGTDATWHVDISTGSDTIALDQHKASATSLVDSIIGQGAQQGQDVQAMGTGTWQSWSGQQGVNGLSKTLQSTGTLISGKVDTGSLKSLADTLLTYETAPPGNNGG